MMVKALLGPPFPSSGGFVCLELAEMRATSFPYFDASLALVLSVVVPYSLNGRALPFVRFPIVET